MNIFRLLGDLSHLLAILILFFKIWKTRSCSDISGRSQILFALVFVTRYLDLLTDFISLYNTLMKIFYILSSLVTIYLVYVKFKATYDKNHDTFRIEFLLIPSVILALVINHEFDIVEILWTFSIYLESVAILPQLFMIIKSGGADLITLYYLVALGAYRGLYILNWIYRYYSEGYYDHIAIIGGIIQTVLYCNFFYLYITRDIIVRDNVKDLNAIDADKQLKPENIIIELKVPNDQTELDLKDRDLNVEKIEKN